MTLLLVQTEGEGKCVDNECQPMDYEPPKPEPEVESSPQQAEPVDALWQGVDGREEKAVSNAGDVCESDYDCDWPETCMKDPQSNRHECTYFTETQAAVAGYEVVGLGNHAVTFFAIIGAMSLVYYGGKAAYEKVYSSDGFTRIDVEC